MNTAMLVVAILAVLVAGREYIGHLALLPEASREHRAGLEALRREIEVVKGDLAKALAELEEEQRRVREEVKRQQDEAERQRQAALEAQRAEREKALHDAITRLQREQERFARALAAARTSASVIPPALRLGVTQGALHAFRITVNRDLNDAERRAYRARFQAGCGTTAVVLDTRAGFLVISEQCQPSTFEGPEFLIERVARQ